MWGRFDRQNIVLQGLLAAIRKPENWGKVPDLVKEARKTILTDLSVDQAMDLKCIIEEVGSDADLLEVEQNMVTVDAQGHWNPDFEAIRALI